MYRIADDLRMIVCCYFRVRFPLKYIALQLRPTEQQEDRAARVCRIKSFWKDNMIGEEFETLLYAVDTADHNLLKERINLHYGFAKYETKQRVQVWWFGNHKDSPSWLDATVLSKFKDGSYQIMYTRNRVKVNTHRTLVLTSHTSRTPEHTHTHTHTHIPTFGSLTGKHKQRLEDKDKGIPHPVCVHVCLYVCIVRGCVSCVCLL